MQEITPNKVSNKTNKENTKTISKQQQWKRITKAWKTDKHPGSKETYRDNQEN